MDDLDRLSSDFIRAQKNSKRLVSEVVLDSGEKMASSMRQRAPVASGDLRDSIGVFGASKTVTDPYGGKTKVPLSAAPGDLSVEVGPTVWYAHFPERGTSRQAPKPYAAPAFDEHVEDFVAKVLDVAADNLW